MDKDKLFDVKRYNIDGKVFTFDILYVETTRCGVVWLGKCRENGKEAWLDSHGVQFDGSRRVEAIQVLPYPYGLPHYSYWD